MYGRFSDAHQRVVRSYVRGRTVVDLGAGDCERTYLLSKLGAKKVHAVDPLLSGKCLDPESFPADAGPIETHCCNAETFEKLVSSALPATAKGRIDVLYLAWPTQNGTQQRSFLSLIERSDVVILTTKNTDGTACGTAKMWAALCKREVLSYRPEKENTLIVYGEPCAYRSSVHYEELMGITMGGQSKPMPYADAMGPISRADSLLLIATMGDAMREEVEKSLPNDEVRAAFRDALRRVQKEGV